MVGNVLCTGPLSTPRQWGWVEANLPPLKHQFSRHGPQVSSVHLCSGYSQEVVCYTLGNIPQMPSAPRLVRAGVTWITLQWSRPEGCSPEEVITYTLDIQEDENVSLARSTPAKHQDILWPKVKAALRFFHCCHCCEGPAVLPQLSSWLLVLSAAVTL